MGLLGLVVQCVASFAEDNNFRRCFMKYAKRMLAMAIISLLVLARAQMVSFTKVTNVNLGSVRKLGHLLSRSHDQ